jgi:hypothetical protein
MRAGSLRPWFSIAAFVLSVLAGAISYFDGDSIELAFFAITAIAASTQAWCVRDFDVDLLRRSAQGIALAWVAAAVWIGVLLMMFQASSGPPPAPEERYLGLTATFFHMAAVYGGALLASVAAFGPRGWLDARARA